MAGKKKFPDSSECPTALRQRAEVLLRENAADTPDMLKALSPDALREMLHNLRVHQIELEMQNEELRAAQAALDTEKARYFDFYDLAPVGYLTLTARGLIKQANLTTATLLGIPRASFLKQSISHFIDKADQEIFYNFRRQAIDNEAPQRCELRMLMPDGTSLWVQLDAIAVPGTYLAPEMRLVLTDINERKQATLALATSEHLFAQFMEALPGAAFIKTDDGVTVYANRYMEDLVGGRNWLGKTAGDLLPPDIAAKMIADDRRALAAGAMVTEERVPAASGQSRHFRTHKFRILRPGQAPLLGGIGLDISDLKRMEQALIESEQFKDTILNSLPAEIAVIDDEGVILAVNQPWQQFGAENGIAKGRPDRHVTVGNNYLTVCQTSFDSGQEAAQQAFEAGNGIREVLAGDRPDFSYEYACHSPTEQRWFIMTVAPLCRGERRGAVISHQSITERKLAEKQLSTLAETLARTVYQRTLQLRTLSAQLTIAEERERRELAQELHDDLIQLLYVLKIRLNLLSPASPAHAITQITNLADQAEHAARTITQKLSPPSLEATGLVGALESLVTEISHHYGINIQLSVEGQSNPLPVALLAVLVRAARELLVNVFKHAGVSEAHLLCRYDEDQLRLSVSDQGAGFDAAQVLGRAGRLSGTPRFGLRSLHERIANIFGEVNVESHLGHGTRVTLIIPYVHAGRETPIS